MSRRRSCPNVQHNALATAGIALQGGVSTTTSTQASLLIGLSVLHENE
jgi:hypothetical protein